MIYDLDRHPLCEIFPEMSDAELDVLAQDIKANGLRHKIILLDRLILDGWNRYRACVKAGVKPKFETFKGDAVALVTSLNLNRRHLKDEQRSMIAAKLPKFAHGGDRKADADQVASWPLDREERAELLNVSVKSVQRADKVEQQGSAALQKAVMAGEVPLSKAASVADLPKRDQLKAACSEFGDGKINGRDRADFYTSGKRNGTPEVVKDKTGYPIPEDILPLWNRGEEVRSLIAKLGEINGAVKRVKDENGTRDILWRECDVDMLESEIGQVREHLRRAEPYAVCYSCQGRVPKGCKSCKGRGFVSQFFYQQCVPRELKDIRKKAYASA